MSQAPMVARSRPPASSRLSFRAAAILYVCTLLTFATFVVSWTASSNLSFWLMSIRWTQGAHGPLQFELAGEIPIIVGVKAALALFLEYGLAYLGWRWFRGRLRLRHGRIIRSWVKSAVLAPILVCLGTILADAVHMLVTRTGYADAPTDCIVFCTYFLIAPVSLARIGVRRRAKDMRPICCRCGYDLTGNTSGVCPECGNKT